MDARYDHLVIVGYPLGEVPEDVAALMLEAANEMVQESTETWPILETPWRADDCVVACRVKDIDEPVGVLVFRLVGEDLIRVVLAYVEPSSRRTGVFTRLWDDLPGKPYRREIVVNRENKLAGAVGNHLAIREYFRLHP